MRKSDSDHATPTLFAMPVSCSVEPKPGICKKRGGDSPGGSLRERGDVSSKPIFAQSFAVGAGLLGTGSSTNARGRARRMFHAE